MVEDFKRLGLFALAFVVLIILCIVFGIISSGLTASGMMLCAEPKLKREFKSHIL